MKCRFLTFLLTASFHVVFGLLFGLMLSTSQLIRSFSNIFCEVQMW